MRWDDYPATGHWTEGMEQTQTVEDGRLTSVYWQNEDNEEMLTTEAVWCCAGEEQGVTSLSGSSNGKDKLNFETVEILRTSE